MDRDMMRLKVSRFVLDTLNMTPSQRGTYILLLARAWANGGVIEADDETLAHQCGVTMEEWEKMRPALSRFFDVSGKVWTHSQMVAEFGRSAKISATMRGTVPAVINTRYGSSRSDGIRKATSKHSPVSTATNTEAHAELADCPHRAIIDLYGQHLPGLRQPRTWDQNRQLVLRTRWREAAAGQFGRGYTTLDDGIAWWGRFFRYIKERCPPIATGIPRKDQSMWQADLDWILKRANFIKIIEGAYEQR